jgi:hypothetical protein
MVSSTKARSLGMLCTLLVMLACVASAASIIAAPGAIQLSASQYSVDASASALTITVNRVGGSSGAAVVTYGTFDGSAAAGTDYTASSGTLIWADGDTTPRTITLSIIPGGPGGRSFAFALLSVSGADFGTPIDAAIAISPATGSVALSAANYSVAASAGAVTVIVNRVGGSTGSAIATYGTFDGSAIAGADYAPSFGTLTWANGDSSARVITVPIIPGATVGGNFTIALLSVSGAAFGTPIDATVAISPATGAVALSAANYGVAANAGAVTVTVNRVGGSIGSAVATYGTFDGSAIAGTDYAPSFGTLTWADGDATPRTIAVSILPTGAGARSFTVALLSVSGAGFGTPIDATVSISVASSVPSSPSPTSSTASLLAYISGLSGQSRHILSGQHSNYWDLNPMDIVTPIPVETGSQVAILGLTNFEGGTASTDYGTAPESFVQYANGWLGQGGIVLASQWPLSPLASGEPYADIHTPGTAAYIQWHAYLDQQIAKFKQIDGPVIWRPFVEINGSWSWWPGQNPADFQIIWQQMHDYFAANGVTNILWLFNVNDWDSAADVNSWYPGDAYVDLVSLDAYPPNLAGDSPVYDALVATGKPIMYAEVGAHGSDNSSVAQQTYDNSALLDTIEAYFPDIFAVVVWCQNQALPLQLGESAFMSNPAVITLAQVAGGS